MKKPSTIRKRLGIAILSAILLYTIILTNILSKEYSRMKKASSQWIYIAMRDSLDSTIALELKNPIVNSTVLRTTSQILEKAKPHAPKIFCIILTAPENIYKKAKQVKDIWGYKCDDYRVVAKLPAPVNHSVDLKVLDPPELAADTYKQLTRKMMSTFKFLYLHHGDFDWYLKADDDTFIFVDNLRTFLSDKNASGPVTYGYDFKVIVKGGFHSGGAGYVLSRESMGRIGWLLHKNISLCEDSGKEDVDVASCLRKLGVSSNKSIDAQGRERFHPYDVRVAVKGNVPYGSDFYASNPIRKVNQFKNFN